MRTIVLMYAVLILSLFTACSQEDTSPEEKEPEFAVMAYYIPDNTISPATLPLSKLTHIIISFTEVINNKMAFPDPGQYEMLRDIVKARNKYPGLKVMVACGGWGGSGGFSDMAASTENRKIFVKSVIDFMEKNKIDGLDIDWEYPGMPGIGNPYRTEDKENFTSLMKELRMAMNKTGKQYVLTFAAAGWERYFDHIELGKVMKYADYINMMTYDFEGGYTPVAAHHTNLGKVGLFNVKSEAGKSYFKESPKSAEKIISFVRSKGVDPKQIVIGCAFYGRGWKGVPPADNGLYQANKGYWKTLSYDRIHDIYENKNGFVRHWDEAAKAAFLYNPADSVFITYDDAMSVKLKTEYAGRTGLGGVMFWELKHDLKNNILLNAISTEVKQFAY